MMDVMAGEGRRWTARLQLAIKVDGNGQQGTVQVRRQCRRGWRWEWQRPTRHQNIKCSIDQTKPLLYGWCCYVGSRTARQERPPRPLPEWPVRKEGTSSVDNKNCNDANANINTYPWQIVWWWAHHKIGQIHGGDGTKCQSPPRWIAPKPSASGIAHGVWMTSARLVGASSCTRWWYGPKLLTTMVASDTKLMLRQGWFLWPTKYLRTIVYFCLSSKQLQPQSQDSH